VKGKGFVNFLAYISIAFIAVALILGKIFSAFPKLATVTSALSLIAQVIAYAITAVYAFYFAKSKKHITWMICYILFVIAIIVFLVLGIV
jgi:hypothetical protein